jgi:hypothetical protein
VDNKSGAEFEKRGAGKQNELSRLLHVVCQPRHAGCVCDEERNIAHTVALGAIS